jgi:hypothetical protein
VLHVHHHKIHFRFQQNVKPNLLPTSKIQSNIIIMRDHVHASSDSNGTKSKSTIVKAGCGRSTFTSTAFTSPNMVVLPPPAVSDHHQSSSSPSPHNRPRIVSLEFNSSPPQPPHSHHPRHVTALPNIMLSRSRSKNKSLDEFDEHEQHCAAVTPDSKPKIYTHFGPPDQEIHLGMRPKVLDARTVRVLGLPLAPSSSPLFSPLPLSFHSDFAPLATTAAARRPSKNDEIDMLCWTPAPSCSGSEDIWMNMPGPPALPEMKELRSRNHMLLPKQTMPRALFVPDDF